MKILLLTPWYPDDLVKNHGIFVQEQARALAEHHEVIVISSKVDYKKFGLASFFLMKSIVSNVTEYRLVVNRSLPIYNQLNYFFISTKMAFFIARDFKPDIVHGNIGYPGGFWSYLVAIFIGREFIITEHTSNFKNNFRSLFHKWLTLFSLRRAKAVLTVSQHSAVEIQKYLNREVLVIPNMIRVERFTIKPFLQGTITIGFLGALASPSHAKGLNVLLRVLSRVSVKFKLLIGGDGKLLDYYKDLADQLKVAEQCEFVGFVNYEEVPAFMNRLHFFVNAAEHESFGIALIEAMASGLPVVSFDNGGPADFIDSSNGILVENQNEIKLKEAIDWMISNYQNFDRSGIRNLVISRYSKSNFVKQMGEIYDLILR